MEAVAKKREGGAVWAPDPAALGEEVAVTSNRPLDLSGGDGDGEAGAWYVAQGPINVFAERRDEGGETSARVFMLTADSGGLLFAMGGNGEYAGDLAFVAAGGPGGRAAPVRLADVLRGESDGVARAGLCAAVDAWLTALAGAVGGSGAPRDARTLEAGGSVVTDKEGAAMSCGAGVVWLEHPAGAARYCGQWDIPARNGSGSVPLTPATWALATVKSASVRARGTAEVLESGELWAALRAFHELFAVVARQRVEDSLAGFRARFAARRDLDEHAADLALRDLLAVVEPGRGAVVPAAAVEDPLLAACRLVGGALGMTVVPPAKDSGAPVRRRDPLGELARASRFRTRAVVLKGDWWERSNGPLLAFLELEGDRKRPVALLPVGATGYELVDAAENRRQPVDEPLARRLSGIATMFYPALPARPLGAKDLWRFGTRSLSRELVPLLLVGLAGGVLNMLTPILTGYLFGDIIPGAERGQLAQLAAALFAAAVAASLFEVTRSIGMLRISGVLDASLQAAVWDRVMSLPASFFRRFTVGDLASRTMGISRIRQLLSGTTVNAVLGALFSVFNFGLLYYYSASVAAVATAVLLILIATTALLTWVQLRHQRALNTVQGRISSFLFEILSAISKIRVAALESRVYREWASRFSVQRRLTYSARRAGNGLITFNAAYPVLASMAVFAAVLYVNREATALGTGDFLAFNAALGQLVAAAIGLVGALSGMLQIIPLYERLQPILAEQPEEDPARAAAGELSGAIEFSHVSFRYKADGPLILDDVSVRAEPGEFIALVGPSGSGKSTMLRLLLGFETPEAGSIYYDRQDLAGLDLQGVRRQIGVVLQNSKLMSGDIMTNIVGSSLLTVADAWEAARLAGLEADIKAMPMGMHTLVSEGAATFSGGQRQRLMIARAIVTRPRMLFFDEATSALDNRTQKVVSQSLEGLKATRIVIAHRLSTIMNADRIYVLDRGRVVQSGRYAELVAQEGLFAELVRRQMV
ncbi:MAG: NHLP bacteriocin export ABC transporter permease/ATPase subunit [Candidatus Schekmanbacteria bacterium]|nr:NHLP bacteriocin export ABC transporter permease/ATPase subunit [Candidatus Schekmanbacteria bacterium]